MTGTSIDYSTVTESPGTLVSREAMDMVLTRYMFAAGLCQGKRVLEVACGPGVGLGFLSSRAQHLVAGDYTDSLLRQAAAHYGARVPLIRLDATHLPFGHAAFDVVLLFEAIYFLPDVPAFLASCHRVLGPGGVVILATVNPEWDAFNPSPNATRYWTAEELAGVLQAEGFRPEMYAAFPASDSSPRGGFMAALKRFAVRFDLIPKTMKGKELMKRVAFGRQERVTERPAPIGRLLTECHGAGDFKSGLWGGAQGMTYRVPWCPGNWTEIVLGHV